MKKNITANKTAMLNIFAAVFCILIYSCIFFLKVSPYITLAFLVKNAIIGCLLAFILASTAFALSSSSTIGTRKFMVLLNGMLILLAAYDCVKFAYFSLSIWSYFLAPLTILFLALHNIQALRRLIIVR